MSDPRHFPPIRAIMLLLGLLAGSAAATPAAAGDVAEGAGNVVMGVGLVIGLAGTGDSSVDAQLVDNSIVGVLRQAGLDVWQGQIAPGRVAKVMVTAELPADAGSGAPVAISVTALGDAASLSGGTLLATPLRGLDGQLLAMGQGRVATGERSARVVPAAGETPTGRRNIAMADGIALDTGDVSGLVVD
jgi:flagellar P-ring protein FlgI